MAEEEEDEETFVFLEFAGLPDDKLLKSYTGKCSLLVRLLSFCSFKYMHLFSFIIMFSYTIPVCRKQKTPPK